ncbi:MAG: NUDIX hydrolase [Bacteroidetes bacterium]|nr:MAG: NUDIX hydrolase [Bacteroidota bacterium]PTM10047.1 MAG: NUDIX hydrolase [Bacteroidota bacterium]
MEDRPPHWFRSRFAYGPHLKLFQVRFDWMVNPRNNHEEKMIVLEGGDSVQVVAETVEGEILLVRQYRFGVGALLEELPGGLVDPGEAPAVAAQRELREETGYVATEWQYLGKHAANPVFMNAYVHHFAARGISREGAPRLDKGEDVKLTTVSREALKARLLRSEFPHPHTVCALLAYLTSTGDLK